MDHHSHIRHDKVVLIVFVLRVMYDVHLLLNPALQVTALTLYRYDGELLTFIGRVISQVSQSMIAY